MKKFALILMLFIVDGSLFAQEYIKDMWQELNVYQKDALINGVLAGIFLSEIASENYNEYLIQEQKVDASINRSKEIFKHLKEEFNGQSIEYWAKAIDAFYLKKGNENISIQEALFKIIMNIN